MAVIDSYPEFVREDELQANLEPKPLDLAVQGSPASRLAALRSLVVDSVSSPNSKRAYGKAVDAFLTWHEQEPRAPFSKAILQSYRSTLEQIQMALGHASIQATERYLGVRQDLSDAPATISDWIWRNKG
jgi:hypothetical protein